MEVILSLSKVYVVRSTNFMQLSMVEYLSKFIVIYLDQDCGNSSLKITNFVIIKNEERFKII